ncbi:MAG TPA: glycosyltransferase [Haliangiales bacterium]|nr:glycosyltransferase [Haliangiales bacterium]
MARILFVVPPLVGHTNPTVSVAAALGALGHAVAWAAHPDKAAPLLPPRARILSLGACDESVFAPILERSRRVRGLEGLQFLWRDFLVPLARAMLPAVDVAIAEARPDLVVVDQQAIGGALAARRRGVPWATLCTTSAELTDPLAGLPKVKAWTIAQLAALQEEAGLPVVERPDLSPRLVVVLSTPALIGDVSAFPPQCRFVGPSIHERPDATPFPWDALEERPRVLVSLGTVNAERGEAFYRTAFAALAGAPFQVILVAPDGLGGAPPPGFLVRPRVPQLALLPHVQAVVSHGGHNTVCEALAHGIPLVVTPIKDDQPVIAEQVVRAGCGLRLRFGRLEPAALRAAVDRVLNEPSFRDNAARVAASFATAGGARAAARLLDEVV